MLVGLLLVHLYNVHRFTNVAEHVVTKGAAVNDPQAP